MSKRDKYSRNFAEIVIPSEIRQETFSKLKQVF